MQELKGPILTLVTRFFYAYFFLNMIKVNLEFENVENVLTVEGQFLKPEDF
jgi:hypothetical protein